MKNIPIQIATRLGKLLYVLSTNGQTEYHAIAKAIGYNTILSISDVAGIARNDGLLIKSNRNGKAYLKITQKGENLNKKHLKELYANRSDMRTIIRALQTKADKTATAKQLLNILYSKNNHLRRTERTIEAALINLQKKGFISRKDNKIKLIREDEHNLTKRKKQIGKNKYSSNSKYDRHDPFAGPIVVKKSQITIDYEMRHKNINNVKIVEHGYI